MGIDWVRMRPKPNADPQTLARLIKLQADGFQRGYPGWWTTRGQSAPGDEQELCWRRQYLEASRELQDLLDFPPHDPDTGVAVDEPDFHVGRRNYSIARNSIFPQRWQVEANRTFLPQELSSQLTIWKEWLAEVAAGKHQAYLLQQYLHETTTDLQTYSQQLTRIAQESLSATGNWSQKPELVAVREQIFSFKAPPIHPAPIFPWPETDDAEVPIDHPALLAIAQKIDELIGLTRNWDRRVKGSRKLGYYPSYYQSFPEYVGQANSPGLQEEIEWLEACNKREMGVFLDY